MAAAPAAPQAAPQRGPVVGYRPRPLAEIACWRCGELGHIASTCSVGPNVQRGGRGGRGGRGDGRGGRGRAFMAPAAAQGRLQGTLFYADKPCRVLFDSGASHSFISRSYCMSRGFEIGRVGRCLSIGTPTGVTVDLHEVVRKHEFRFLDRVFVLDLYVLDFGGFDMILGMDWLEKNSAVIDCGRRRIILLEPGKEIVHECEPPKDSIMTSFLYTLEIPEKVF